MPLENKYVLQGTQSKHPICKTTSFQMIPASSLPWISAAEIPDIRTQTTYSHTLPASNVNKMQLLFSIVMCWSDLASWISNHDRHHLCYTKHWYGRVSFIHILYWNLTFQANIQSSCIVNILLLLGFQCSFPWFHIFISTPGDPLQSFVTSTS